MSLAVLAGSLLAVGLLVALAFLLGPRMRHRLSGPEEAVRRYLDDFWEDEIQEACVSATRHAALLSIRTQGGEAVGLVSVHGDKMVTRRLGPGMVSGIKWDPLEDGSVCIRFRLRELSGGRLALVYPDAKSAQTWYDRLQALTVERTHLQEV